MRVTQSMLAANSLRNLSDSYLKLGNYQNQLSTGKKITKPSDDPVVAMKGMFYRSQLTEVDQYKRNLSELNLWMDNSDAGLQQVTSSLQRVRELVVQGSNGTLTSDDQKAIAEEVSQLTQQIANIGNTKVGGKYIFHGNDVINPPVKLGIPPQVAANISDGSVKNYNVEVSSGVSLQANVNPANIFSQELFSVLDRQVDQNGNTVQDGIVSSLETNQPDKLGALLTRLDNVMDKISAENSDLGARTNRLDMVGSRLDQQDTLATKVLSDNEDANIEEVITNLTTQESVHRAALSVGSQIIQPTLMDFLK